MDQEKRIMLDEIALQPAFVRDNIDEVLARMRGVLADKSAGDIQHAFLIGCGDSYSAAVAVRRWMMLLTGRYCEAVEALEFSRYLVDHLPPGSVVFGVSNSGTVARTIEGVRLAREAGAWTFGVTVAEDNKLAKTAETLLKLNSPPNIKVSDDGSKVVTPGTLTYTASMLGLYIAAIAFAEKLGALDAAGVEARVADLRATADHMAEAERLAQPVCEDLARTLTPDRKTVILGGGPNYATGYFAMAKWFESLGQPAHFSQIEEWAHEHYFFTREDTDTIVILPRGRSHDRGLEQMEAAREMGSRVIAIAEQGDTEAAARADVVIPMPDGVVEELSPFVYKLPFEYLSCHVAHNRGVAFLGFDDAKRQQVNFRQIFDSKERKRETTA